VFEKKSPWIIVKGISLTKSIFVYGVKSFIGNMVQRSITLVPNIMSPAQIVAIITLHKIGVSMEIIGLIILFL
jgi:hypothetical protein